MSRRRSSAWRVGERACSCSRPDPHKSPGGLTLARARPSRPQVTACSPLPISVANQRHLPCERLPPSRLVTTRTRPKQTRTHTCSLSPEPLRCPDPSRQTSESVGFYSALQSPHFFNSRGGAVVALKHKAGRAVHSRLGTGRTAMTWGKPDCRGVV
ncbi:hypothetical protein E2C01_006103 [Portunus trituberculatus]|uniref:Uncharacterized protein n=1 Tax=Portunus trituberculatus TaxID=210409 RepID=A0A5B7CUD7_PORTR|nr:hypothetical protein [Portunus trituberculatus]